MMDVRTARTWAEGAQLALQSDKKQFAPEALPSLVEALAILGRQEYQMRCQLNATKTRLQSLQLAQRTAAKDAAP